MGLVVVCILRRHNLPQRGQPFIDIVQLVIKPIALLLQIFSFFPKRWRILDGFWRVRCLERPGDLVVHYKQ